MPVISSRAVLGSYQELKSAVLSGRDLGVRAEVSACSGANLLERGIDTFIVSHRIKSARIVNEGMKDR
jgi:hypothetical protein